MLAVSLSFILVYLMALDGMQSVAGCQDGFTPIGPCVDGLCPADYTCSNSLCCAIATAPAVRVLNTSSTIVGSTSDRPLVAEVVVSTCVDRGANCAALSAGRQCFNLRIAVRLWRQCQRSCGYCGVSTIRQLESEVRVRQIATGALTPRAQPTPSFESEPEDSNEKGDSAS